MSKKVFQVRDTSDPDIYYAYGIWPTLESAVEAFTREFPGGPDGVEAEECLTIEIHAYELGKHDSGTCVHVIRWVEYYDEDNDASFWQLMGTEKTN